MEESELDINVKGAQGRTPLHRAVSAKKVDLVTCLLDKHKAEINAIDNK